MRVMQNIRHFAADETGQDIVEYVLLALIIGLGAIAGMNNLATAINTVFRNVQTSLT